VLPDHAPMLAVLVQGVVEVRTDDGEVWTAAVDSGFLSVANNRVSILSERAEMAHEIDIENARRELEKAQSAGEDDEEAREQVRSAEARIRAVERAG